MPVGRPTDYLQEYNEQAYKLCLLGAIDTEMSDFFGVSEVTINAWKQKHPEFLKSINQAKTISDERVVRSLYERATGYSHPEDKIFNDNGNPLVVPTEKHYPPDATSCIFWLKNRDPSNWRDKQDHEHSGQIDGDRKYTVEIIRPKEEGNNNED